MKKLVSFILAVLFILSIFSFSSMALSDSDFLQDGQNQTETLSQQKKATSEIIINEDDLKIVSAAIDNGMISQDRQFETVILYSAADADAEWKKVGNDWFLYVNGELIKGIYVFKGTHYVFDNSTGAMQTGWTRLQSASGEYNWFYHGPAGDPRTTTAGQRRLEGTYVIDGYYYRINQYGHMLTGWVRLQSSNGDYNWFYHGPSGDPRTTTAGQRRLEGTHNINGYYYRINASGHMLTGWIQLQSSNGAYNWFYHGPSGDPRTTTAGQRRLEGTHNINGYYYRINASGHMLTGWVQLADSNGVMQYYYHGPSGNPNTTTAGRRIVAAGFHQISGKWYYFRDGGARMTDTRKINGVTYYFKSSTGECVNKDTSYIRPLTSWSYISKDYQSGHQAIDLAVGTGAQVKAVRGGRVITALKWNYSYGYHIVIDHGDGMHTLYAHCSRLDKNVGDIVSQGEVIALSGSTGNSDGPHLHFEIRKNGVHQNPRDYIKF